MKSKKTYYMNYWLPPLIYCMLIFLPSMFHIAPAWVYDLDKLVHFAVYMVLGFLLFRAFTTLSTKTGHWVTIALSFFFSVSIAVLDEIFQVFTPLRTVDRVDLLFDIFGSLTGIVLFACVRRFIYRTEKID